MADQNNGSTKRKNTRRVTSPGAQLLIPMKPGTVQVPEEKIGLQPMWLDEVVYESVRTAKKAAREAAVPGQRIRVITVYHDIEVEETVKRRFVDHRTATLS